MIYVDAQNLAEQQIYVLRVVGNVVAAAPAARRGIEVPVRSKPYCASVVIGVGRVRHFQDWYLGCIRNIRVRGDVILCDHYTAVSLLRVVDKEPPVVFVVRVKRQSE